MKAILESKLNDSHTYVTFADEIKQGTYKKLFHPDQMLTGKEDAVRNCFLLKCFYSFRVSRDFLHSLHFFYLTRNTFSNFYYL